MKLNFSDSTERSGVDPLLEGSPYIILNYSMHTTHSIETIDWLVQQILYSR